MPSVPDLVKSDLSSPADRGPGRGRKGSAWLPAPLETQPCPGAAPGHVSDSVASQSGGQHWQPRVLTASVRWCGVPQTKRVGPHATPCHFCVTEETLKALDVCGTKWLLQSLECRLSSLFGWGGGGGGGGAGLGKGILAFSGCTHHLMGTSALNLPQEQISQAFVL